jgi:hypothetical protein
MNDWNFEILWNFMKTEIFEIFWKFWNLMKFFIRFQNFHIISKFSKNFQNFINHNNVHETIFRFIMQNTGKRCVILLVFIILRWSFNYESNVFRFNKILIDCVFGNSKFVVVIWFVLFMLLMYLYGEGLVSCKNLFPIQLYIYIDNKIIIK